ncbi:MAG: septal ring factor EnvC (AmiA/AmiB activator) [Bacteroidia bacterium]|jgi:septal ring factor EnvC (AmiA/AmiB activator)
MPMRWLTVAAVSTVLCCSLAASSDGNETRTQLNALKSRIGALQTELNGKREQRNSAQKALREVETQLGALQRKLRNTNAAIAKQQQQLKSLTKRKFSLRENQRKQQSLIKQQILAAYQLGQEKKLKMLLNQESPDKLSRALVYYDYFNKARTEQIKLYLGTIEELDAIAPAIAQQSLKLSASRNHLNDQKTLLANKQSQRTQTLAALDKQIGSRDENLKAMRTEQDDLLKLLSAIEEEVANISLPDSYSPFNTHRGKMNWPAVGKHLNRFGSSRGDSPLTWNGIEIAANRGSDVKAIHHGRVVFADWLRGAGLLIILDHGDGYMSLYGHNESLLFETGDWVKARDAIATVGNSGGRNKASLYFEVRKNGKPTNPARWCRG